MAIIPILSGEGMKIKCSDYISLAIPFISTKKGVQGIEFLKNGEDFLLFNTVDQDFINAIKFLANNTKLRKKMHQNLLKKSKYLNQDTFSKNFNKIYSAITNNKKL